MRTLLCVTCVRTVVVCSALFHMRTYVCMCVKQIRTYLRRDEGRYYAAGYNYNASLTGDILYTFEDKRQPKVL
jgi:hypothetical protein